MTLLVSFVNLSLMLLSDYALHDAWNSCHQLFREVTHNTHHVVHIAPVLPTTSPTHRPNN